MSTSDKERLLNWLKTHQPVPLVGFIVAGNNGKPAQYKAYACLYPTEPKLRIFNDGIMPDEELRQRAATCELPSDADERQVEFVRERMRGMGSAVKMREVAEALAIKDGLPLGCFAVGRTEAGIRKYVIWVSALVTPSSFLRELRAAASR